jgi:hypothetical protein
VHRGALMDLLKEVAEPQTMSSRKLRSGKTVRRVEGERFVADNWSRKLRRDFCKLCGIVLVRRN